MHVRLEQIRSRRNLCREVDNARMGLEQAPLRRLEAGVEDDDFACVAAKPQRVDECDGSDEEPSVRSGVEGRFARHVRIHTDSE
jgi:hypothetical protein